MSHLPTYQPNWNGVFTCLPYSPQSTHNLASHPPLPSPSLRLPATPLNSPSSPPLQFLPSQQPQQKQGRFLVAPPLAVQQTKNSPLTPTAQYDQDQGVRKVGKALSCYTKSMEMVWHGEFNRLCQYFLPHHWYLSPTFSIPQGDNWLTFKDSAKVRFLCNHCSHGWTSMKGRVVYWFTLDESVSTGIVFFKLFGQRCQRCTPQTFEHAMWYPEEVLKVISNVFNRIGQEYYGFYKPPVRIDRRSGKPQAKHNADMCQACTEGMCPASGINESLVNDSESYQLTKAINKLVI